MTGDLKIKASFVGSPIPTPESPNPIPCLSAEIFIHSVGFRFVELKMLGTSF
jgi:hypothetical protein